MLYQETSRAAWDAHLPEKAELDRAICAALGESAVAGMTDQELEEKLRRPHQSVSANRRHLVEKEFVKATKLRRVLRSGRNAIVWVLAEHYDETIHA